MFWVKTRFPRRQRMRVKVIGWASNNTTEKRIVCKFSTQCWWMMMDWLWWAEAVSRLIFSSCVIFEPIFPWRLPWLPCYAIRVTIWNLHISPFPFCAATRCYCAASCASRWVTLTPVVFMQLYSASFLFIRLFFLIILPLPLFLFLFTTANVLLSNIRCLVILTGGAYLQQEIPPYVHEKSGFPLGNNSNLMAL